MLTRKRRRPAGPDGAAGRRPAKRPCRGATRGMGTSGRGSGPPLKSGRMYWVRDLEQKHTIWLPAVVRNGSDDHVNSDDDNGDDDDDDDSDDDSDDCDAHTSIQAKNVSGGDTASYYLAWETERNSHRTFPLNFEAWERETEQRLKFFEAVFGEEKRCKVMEKLEQIQSMPPSSSSDDDTNDEVEVGSGDGGGEEEDDDDDDQEEHNEEEEDDYSDPKEDEAWSSQDSLDDDSHSSSSSECEEEATMEKYSATKRAHAASETDLKSIAMRTVGDDLTDEDDDDEIVDDEQRLANAKRMLDAMNQLEPGVRRGIVRSSYSGEMDALNRATFLRLPDRKKSLKFLRQCSLWLKESNSQERVLDIEECLFPLQQLTLGRAEPSGYGAMRWDALQHSLAAVDRISKTTITSLYRGVVEGVSSYLIEGGNYVDTHHHIFSVRAASLGVGSVEDDHDYLYEGLRDSIVEQSRARQLTPIIARLRPTHAQSKGKAVSCLVLELAREIQKVFGPSSDDKRRKRSMADIDRLLHIGPERPHCIVVIIEGVERIPIDVLNHIVEVCSTYSHWPITLAFGTSTNMVRKMLSPSVVGKLDMQHFSLAVNEQVARDRLNLEEVCVVLTHEQLDEVVDHLFIAGSEDWKLRLKGDTLSFLLNNFIHTNHSVSQFLSDLKLALMHHFYTQPLSCLPHRIDSGASGFHEEHLRLIDNLPSIRKGVKLSSEDCDAEGYMRSYAEMIASHQRSFPRAFNCYVRLASYYRAQSRASLYAAFLKEEKLRPFWNEGIVLMQLETAEKSRKLLQEWCSILDQCEDFREWKMQCEGMLQVLPSSGELSVGVLKKLLIFIKETLTENVIHYKRLALFELYYFGGASVIKACVSPNMRLQLLHSLAYPGELFNCTCCPKEGEETTNMEHVADIFILKLRAFSLQIDIDEWFMDFCLEIGESAVDNLEASLRFAWGVNELYHMGIVERAGVNKPYVKRAVFDRVAVDM